MPARPTRPVPSRPRVPGSGVTAKSPLTMPFAVLTVNTNPSTTSVLGLALISIKPPDAVSVPLNVPLKSAPPSTSIVPFVKVHPVAQFPTNVPVVIVTVPVAGVIPISSNWEVTLYVPPPVGVEVDCEAVVPRFPPKAKSWLVASATVGSASASNANKTTRLINFAPPFCVSYFWGKFLAPWRP